MLLFELVQCRKRVRHPLEASLVGGDQVQRVAVSGRCNRKGFGRGERFRVLATLA